MNNIRTYILLAGSLFALASCNDFLDTIPDDRTEIDSEQKITNILVSAYPEVSTILISELPTMPKTTVRCMTYTDRYNGMPIYGMT